MDKDFFNIPASFRVIGVGSGAGEIINKVKAFGFEVVSAEVVDAPSEATPTEEDKLAIIVSIDKDETANIIAGTFHEAGVLTIGLSEDADPSCFDSVLEGAVPNEYPEVIESLLRPVVIPGYISFDFSDLNSILRDSGSFIVRKALGDDVKKAVENMKNEIKDIHLQNVKNLSCSMFFNRERLTTIKLCEVASTSEIMSAFPDTVNVIWSVNYDDTLHDNQSRLVFVLSGKEVGKGLKK